MMKSTTKLSYTDAGTGSPLILLHAFPLNRRMWEAQVETFSRSWRVIAPDYPGFGESESWNEPFTLEILAEAIDTLIQEAGIHEKAVLLGLSMGGYLAFELVHKFQDRLKGLILSSTHPALDSEAGRQARFETAAFVQRDGAAALAGRMIPRLLGKSALENRRELPPLVQALIESNSVEGIVQACHAMANRRDAIPLLPQIQIPTLIISGTEDSIPIGMPPAEMHNRIGSSRWEVIENGGHLINLEQPQAFNQTVLSFLNSL
jgi:3-oxoadipate enol-lactonase